MRSGATVRRFSARPGAVVQRFAVSDVAPWPDAVAAQPDATPVGQVAPLQQAAQGAPWPGAAQGAPWQEAVQAGPWRRADEPLLEATQDGP